jgi:hypothetical protein
MMSGHLHKTKRKPDFNPLASCRHFIQSPAFARRFSGIGAKALFDAITGYCGSQGGGSLGQSELVLADDNGHEHRFYFETFFNKYDALTLGVYVCPELRMIAA